ADRREAVRRLRLRALVVADAEEALDDEPNHRREHAPALERRALQVGADAAAQRGQRLAELHDAPELRLLLLRAETRVIEVLRAPLLVDADRLQRRGIAARDAHLLPRRRNAQPADPGEGLLIGDR